MAPRKLLRSSSSNNSSSIGSTSSARPPPLWLLVLLMVVIQVGFGGYGIVLQKFAKDHGADALVFSTLRCVCSRAFLPCAFMGLDRVGITRGTTPTPMQPDWKPLRSQVQRASSSLRWLDWKPSRS